MATATKIAAGDYLTDDSRLVRVVTVTTAEVVVEDAITEEVWRLPHVMVEERWRRVEREGE